MAVFALVAASEFNQQDFLLHLRAGAFDRVLAVDGGFAHLEAIGVHPDVVLGDFDSLGFVPDHEQVVEHPPVKDKSDLELALDLAWEQGATSLRAYGCLGGRLDHTLSALQALCAAAERGMDVCAVGLPTGEPGYEQGMVATVLPGPARLELSPPPGYAGEFAGVVSVHAVCDRATGVDETGLQYELHGAELTNRTSLGLSNELAGGPCSISVENGTLLVIHPAMAVRRVILGQ
ncbi:MAG: thiamine diphosphokinase [Coriobacteriia bacterium]|nr:thiamine diphosphokinase [Coriobacteriia bacterium]